MVGVGCYSRMNGITLRRIPYPYRAVLCISNDIDGTDTVEVHHEIQSFMRRGIGVDFSNTFFPFHDENKFSFFSSRSGDKETIIAQIQSGEIDAIHSFGEKNDFSRRDAETALAELRQSNCRINIWIDHAESPSNLCKHRFVGHGDSPDRREYHFDLLYNFGIRYIWTERLSNIVGQETPLTVQSVLRIFDKSHPNGSFLQMTKTAAKIFLSWLGVQKYDFFKTNLLVKPAVMQDNRPIYEFIRFNNHCKGAAVGDSFEDLHYLISKRVLERLKKVEGFSIVYIHLGKKFNLASREAKRTVAALRNLRKEFDSGQILLWRLEKILNYSLIVRHLRWDWNHKNGIHQINIQSIDDPLGLFPLSSEENLKNITFYIPNGAEIELRCRGKKILGARRNPPDHRGQESITIL